MTIRRKFPLPNTSAAHWVKGVGGNILFSSLNVNESGRISFCLGQISLLSVRFGALSSLSLSSLGLLSLAF